MTEARSRVLFPLVLSVALFASYFLIRAQPIKFGRYGDVREVIFGIEYRGLLFVAVVPLIVVAVRIFDALAFDIVSRRRNLAAPRLLRDIIGLTLYFLLISWAVSILFDYSLAKWLAATTVVAAVLALALQETLGNLCAGIALHLEDSFEVGDVIRSGEFIGVVEGLSWRATRVRSFSGNSVVILPNAVLTRERLEVFPRRNLNARIIEVKVAATSAPADVIPLLTRAASDVEGVSAEMPCIARISALGQSEITYELKYFTREFEQRDRIDADVKKAIWYALR